MNSVTRNNCNSYNGFIFTTARQFSLSVLGPEARLRTLDRDFLNILLRQKHLEKNRLQTCKATDLDNTWTWTLEEVEEELIRRELAEEQANGDNEQNG